MDTTRSDATPRSDDPPAGGHSTRLPIRLGRWLPVAGLALTAYGLWLHVSGAPRQEWGDGELLVKLAFYVSLLFFLVGPLRQPKRSAPLDERETLLRTRALLAGTMAVAIAAALGAFFFSMTRWYALWTPHKPDDWVVICFALVTIFNCVQPLYSSWATRPLEDD